MGNQRLLDDWRARLKVSVSELLLAGQGLWMAGLWELLQATHSFPLVARVSPTLSYASQIIFSSQRSLFSACRYWRVCWR
ncbi:hypothetical protein BDV41DRAFT_397295 [Aspergillus transmontanensis]|uniref:Uncharacterized protein n=1 Tax=Aspergillus transmontanensis TaxID=1034304 RepID=A0A5N6VPB4_9EURO|nr:hypothetical protein BDV41DRAFT_397295 [Aspergillus transmontanensis]